MAGEEQTHRQGAQVAVDAHGLEGDVARPQRHDHAEEHKQFTASHAIENAAQHP